MIMGPVWVLGGVLAVVAAGRLGRMWLRHRGRRLITCPENQRPQGVELDALHAAATGFVRRPELRLSDCTRWPERAGCGQQCLSQIQTAPDGCLIRNIVARWYEGKSCASCGRPFGRIDWSAVRPAVLLPDKTSVEWSDLPAETLSEVLVAGAPMCIACHLANKLVREHPKLVVKRSFQ